MPRSRAPRVAAGVDELVPADHLGADEALLDVGVDLAGGVPGGQAAPQVPGLGGLVLAGGEERDAGRAARRRRRTTRCRPDSPTPRSARIAAASSSSSSDSSASMRDGDRDGGRALRRGVLGDRRRHRRRRPRRRWRRTAPAWRSAATRSRMRARARRPGTGTVRAGRPACSASIDLAQPRLLGDRGLVAAAGLAHDALVAPLGLLEVGVDQLGLDRLDVGDRVDAALGVDDVRRRRGRARRARSRRSRGCWRGTGCPGPRPGARPRRGRRCRGSRSCRGRRSRRRSSRRPASSRSSRDRHDRDVRLDRRERVVRRLGARLVSALNSEDLPALGIPTIPTFIVAQRSPAAVPSAAPAAMSDG